MASASPQVPGRSAGGPILWTASRRARRSAPCTSWEVRLNIPADAVLLVVDAQVGFEDPVWGARNNPSCDENIRSLLDAFTRSGRPVAYVRHDSREPGSPLAPGSAGNALKPYLDSFRPSVLVTKSVNSCFHGTPDLDEWLRRSGVSTIVVTGITTNHCCETTARVGGNLGYDVLFVLDATHTFDRQGPDGSWFAADELARVSAANLHGEFATVVSTDDVLAALEGDPATS